MDEKLHENLKIIYDFGVCSPRYIYLLLLLPFFIAGLIAMRIAIKKTKPEQTNKDGGLSKLFIIGLIFVIFTVTISGFVLNIGNYDLTKKAYNKQTYKIIEGNIKGFKDEFYPGRGFRYYIFYINGVYFQISNNDFTYYGCTADDIKDYEDKTGKEFSNGSFFRVTYFDNEGNNVILKLETK